MFANAHWAREILGEFDRLQRASHLGWDVRFAGQAGRVPAVNAAVTPQAIEVELLMPGVDPATLEVQIERGVLSISGERPPAAAEASSHWISRERFAGKFRRELQLPQDANADDVKADYREGVLHVRIARNGPPPVRRITVQ